MAGSFIRRIEEQDSRLYELVVPYEDGREAYYKLSIAPLKEESFKKACEDGITVDLNNFGTILESCFIPQKFAPL